MLLNGAFPVEDLLAGCARLKLGHTQSESSLLSPEEADRLKADLDEQAHRATILRRETVLETSSGKILEKRLNATVMRRRHAEGGAPAGGADTPFHFEVEESRDDSFVSPFLGDSSAAEAETPVMFDSGHHEPAAAVEPHRAPEPAAVKPEPPIEEIGAADYEAHLPEASEHTKDEEPEPEPRLCARAGARTCAASSPTRRRWRKYLRQRRRRRRRDSATGLIACDRRRLPIAARST